MVTPVITRLEKHSSLGLRIRAWLDTEAERNTWVEKGRHITSKASLSASRIEQCIPYAIVVQPISGPPTALADALRVASGFRRVIIVPNLSGVGTLCADATDLGGCLGLQINQHLLDDGSQAIKRAMDLVSAVVFSIILLPVMLTIAMAIKVSSPGPVFYRSQRIGRSGQMFFAWKFRTMVRDADSILHQRFMSCPDERREWEAVTKLRYDTRVTAVGKLLRRSSLDELPQLWNVIRGEMSVVGPRPILSEEASRYGPTLELYQKVTPGMTGLWQISGRSDITYRERVELDEYYVRNWSVWLDLYILSRTLKAVLSTRGAW
jgi:Undecaprenyl-phosphate galactose phosphotransferase WbaP